MTGPPYPKPTAGVPLGEFVIGVSPLGMPSPFSVWDTIISQYSNSPALTGIITAFASAIDQTENFESFYSDIWNVLTANDFGLDIWGRIVGINRVINIASQNYFGFAEAAALEGNLGIGGFNQAPFFSGGSVTSNFSLNTETFRQLILAKMAFNVTDGSIPSINRLMMGLFSKFGNAYVQEGQQQQDYFGFAESLTAFGFNQAPFFSGIVANRMTIAYTFGFNLTPVQLGIVQSGVLPRPPGVLSSIVIAIPPPVTGGAGQPGGEASENPPFSGPLGVDWPFHETLPDPYPILPGSVTNVPPSLLAIRVDNPPFGAPRRRLFPYPDFPQYYNYSMRGFRSPTLAPSMLNIRTDQPPKIGTPADTFPWGADPFMGMGQGRR